MATGPFRRNALFKPAVALYRHSWKVTSSSESGSDGSTSRAVRAQTVTLLDTHPLLLRAPVYRAYSRSRDSYHSTAQAPAIIETSSFVPTDVFGTASTGFLCDLQIL